MTRNNSSHSDSLVFFGATGDLAYKKIFPALQLEIDSWRWRGVPFYIRAGKSVAVTCTEILIRLRRPPTMYRHYDLKSNYVRIRISPDVVLAFGFNVTSPVKESESELSELLASRHPCAAEMDAYERVLGDAMAGDATLFAREDYVEEAWRIVDPALKAGAPLHEYEPKTWGPIGNGNVTPPGGWHNPVVNGLK
jgi:glucose-6-phosphate 1-dehydrogenase